jgi:hypothetical protein
MCPFTGFQAEFKFPKQRRAETIPNLFLDWSDLRRNPFLNLITGKGAGG